MATDTRPSVSFDTPETGIEVENLIIGAGAAGFTAALALRLRGEEALIIERDALPRGSTALSAGLIPAPGTRWQATAGIVDTPEQFAADILKKAHDEPDPVIVQAVTRAIGPVLEWLSDRHGLPFSLVTDFTYPGHSARRMHGLPSRSGAELIDRLAEAATKAGVDLLTQARAVTLHADTDRRIHAVTIERPDGTRECVGCKRLILACNGYGGNAALVARHIPQMAGALYFGHPGNQGEAVLWGQALGAGLRHLPGHQGHGSVAHPHGILITWAVQAEGGFMVNTHGRRFCNESRGYSEAAADVIAQPDGLAHVIFDAHGAGVARQFEDFRNAEAQNAVLTAASLDDLAALMRVPTSALAETIAAVEVARQGKTPCPFGRDFAGTRTLAPPFHAVKVTGALFHTQGGLAVDALARVLDEAGKPLPNLLAAGGAACGVSGSAASGYLSGNGLLTAIALGAIAGGFDVPRIGTGGVALPM